MPGTCALDCKRALPMKVTAGAWFGALRAPPGLVIRAPPGLTIQTEAARAPPGLELVEPPTPSTAAASEFSSEAEVAATESPAGRTQIDLDIATMHLAVRAPPGLLVDNCSWEPSPIGASRSCAWQAKVSDREQPLVTRPPPGCWARVVPPGQWATTPGGSGACAECRTALHFRNLPCYFKRSTFMGLLQAHGFASEVDFVYLPMDFKTGQSLGFAFANFRSSDAAASCRAVLQGFSRWPLRSHKVLSIQWSQTQGYEANVNKVCGSGVMQDTVPDEFKPTVFFPDGSVAPFPRSI